MPLPAAHIHEIRTLRKTIGMNIHALRIAKGITLQKLSRLTGIQLRRLDLYELGKHDINLHSLFRIALVFNVETVSLMGTPEQKSNTECSF